MVERTIALMDDTDELHSLVPAGQDDNYQYVMVIYESAYDGNDYLNERYVQLVVDDPADPSREDSWKKNGINRRVEPETSAATLADKLSDAYTHTGQAIVGKSRRPDDMDGGLGVGVFVDAGSERISTVPCRVCGTDIVLPEDTTARDARRLGDDKCEKCQNLDV